MERRELLVSLTAMAATGIAGCTGGGDSGETPTATRTPTKTASETATKTPTATDTPTETPVPTQAQNLGTIEYTIENGDDETHNLKMQMENNEGRVIEELFEPTFEPGERVGAGSAGHEPRYGPFTLTFSTDATSKSYVWTLEECTRSEVQVTITKDGTFAIERTLCQN